MNLYHYIIGGTNLAAVSSANHTTMLRHLSKTMIMAKSYTVEYGVHPDSAGTVTPVTKITVETPIRADLPGTISGRVGTVVSAVQQILLVAAMHLDDDFTTVITTQDRGYPLTGDPVFVVDITTHGQDIASVKEIPFTNGVALYMGIASTSKSTIHNPFAGALATAFYNAGSVLAQRNQPKQAVPEGYAPITQYD